MVSATSHCYNSNKAKNDKRVAKKEKYEKVMFSSAFSTKKSAQSL